MLRTLTLLLAASLCSLWPAAPALLLPDEPPSADEKKVEEEPDDRPFELMVGDQAPQIHVDEWLTGEATTFEKGQVYLIQFWASWTTPSLFGFERLTELQKQYEDKGLVVLGITREDERGNRIFAVKELIKQRAEEIGYRTAWDSAGLTYARYMEPSGYNKIPFVFLVDRTGRIAHCGYLDSAEEPLAELMAGTFDVDAAAKKYDAKLRQLRKKRDIEIALNTALQEGRHGDVLLAMDELIALDPDYRRFAVNKFQFMIRDMKDPEGAYKWALQAKATCLKDDQYALNTLAYSIVIMTDIVPKNFDVAMELALRASEIEDDKDGQIWNTIGSIHYAKGELAEAIAALEKAVELVTHQNFKATYGRTLKKYRDELEKQ